MTSISSSLAPKSQKILSSPLDTSNEQVLLSNNETTSISEVLVSELIVNSNSTSDYNNNSTSLINPALSSTTNLTSSAQDPLTGLSNNSALVGTAANLSFIPIYEYGQIVSFPEFPYYPYFFTLDVFYTASPSEGATLGYTGGNTPVFQLAGFPLNGNFQPLYRIWRPNGGYSISLDPLGEDGPGGNVAEGVLGYVASTPLALQNQGTVVQLWRGYESIGDYHYIVAQTINNPNPPFGAEGSLGFAIL